MTNSALNKSRSLTRKSNIDEVRKSGRSSGIGIRAAMDKMMYKSRFKSASMGDIAFDGSDRSGYQYEADSVENDFTDSEHFAPLSEYARRMGVSAYQAMVESEKEGDICIVEKSYIMIGTRLADVSLFFYALQNLIDMERKVSTFIIVTLFWTQLLGYTHFFLDKFHGSQKKTTDSFGGESRHRY